MKFNLAGVDLFGEPIKTRPDCKLSADFIVPPFSVLSARDGSWQDRKRQWMATGIKSELGRDAITYQIGDKGQWGNTKKTNHLVPGGADANTYWRGSGGLAGNEGEAGTSVFDPVVCELAYRWFSPDGGQTIDPFAGGSVRGVVAHLLGRRYWGCDLRHEQIAANIVQGEEICSADQPKWVCGDAMEVLCGAPKADFVFSCPPYGDLERYSDDPRDLSTMEYHTFMAAYKRIIARSFERLNSNRFACFVVGDFRDTKTGNYRNFVGDTVSAFKQCGFELYNEAILITAIGSLPIRVGKQFTSSRKMGKTHQNILIFVKGNGKEAAKACGALQREYEWV